MEYEDAVKVPASREATRLPPVTQEERAEVDRARAAKKATTNYRDLSDHFALEQQQHRGGWL